MTIQAAHYAVNQRALQFDPIVVAMSVEMIGAPDKIKASWRSADGSPTFELMQIANREYASRGGTAAESIGAVAHALLTNLDIIEDKS